MHQFSTLSSAANASRTSSLTLRPTGMWPICSTNFTILSKVSWLPLALVNVRRRNTASRCQSVNRATVDPVLAAMTPSGSFGIPRRASKWLEKEENMGSRWNEVRDKWDVVSGGGL